jgi:hypothetical protein
MYSAISDRLNHMYFFLLAENIPFFLFCRVSVFAYKILFPRFDFLGRSALFETVVGVLN